MTSNGNNLSACAVLFSGGTDSTCAAAVMAGQYSDVHLLTFYQGRAKDACTIEENIESLRDKFSGTSFAHHVINTKKLVKFISYHRYLRYFWRHRLLVLSTSGFTTLSWHIRTIVFCLEHNIKHVADGLTKELMHFPGHMEEVIDIFKKFYASFGIEYTNPVRDWPIPPDQQFIDRLVVDQHGFFFPSEEKKALADRTTGKYLYDLGIMPSPNIKGSRKDQAMQFDCYPFVLYNMMAFWIYLAFMPYELFCAKMRLLFEDKTRDMKQYLDDYVAGRDQSRLYSLIQ